MLITWIQDKNYNFNQKSKGSITLISFTIYTIDDFKKNETNIKKKKQNKH